MPSPNHAAGQRDAALACLQNLPVSLLFDAKMALGLPDTTLDPCVRLLAGHRILARAHTIGRIPKSPNAGQEEIDPGLSFAIQEVIDACGPDSVLVIATQGIASHANWGGNMAVRASMVGAQGLVTDGAVRDLHEMEELGMNIFAQGTSPRAGQHRLATTLRNQPVMCAGVYIRPGDILVGDGDGVIVIDPAQAEQIAAKAHELLRIESDMQNYMRNGASLLQAVKKYRIR